MQNHSPTLFDIVVFMAYFCTRCQNKATEKMMMILAVMQKALEHSRVGGVIINNQILHAFRKKIPYLQEAFNER